MKITRRQLRKLINEAIKDVHGPIYEPPNPRDHIDPDYGLDDEFLGKVDKLIQNDDDQNQTMGYALLEPFQTEEGYQGVEGYLKDKQISDALKYLRYNLTQQEVDESVRAFFQNMPGAFDGVSQRYNLPDENATLRFVADEIMENLIFYLGDQGAFGPGLDSSKWPVMPEIIKQDEDAKENIIAKIIVALKKNKVDEHQGEWSTGAINWS